MADIQELIAKEVVEAREVCDVKGDGSKECAVAWDAVEELQAEAAHKKSQEPVKTSLEKYCDTNPEADECRLYEN